MGRYTHKIKIRRQIVAQIPSVFQHILVPTDGSDPSIAAGKLAINLAASNGAHLTGVFVVDDVVVDSV